MLIAHVTVVQCCVSVTEPRVPVLHRTLVKTFGALVIKALCYKPGGDGFETR
jgi:hypothetical protein